MLNTVLCAISNRLRGTGVLWFFTSIIVFSKKIDIKFVGTHLYALYLGLVVGLLTMDVYAGLLTVVAFMVGESKGWGEWVGTLTRYEPMTPEVLEKNYKDNEGKTFPYIHQISNFFIKEQKDENIYYSFSDKVKQYFRYARLALTLRGLWWWSLVYTVMYMYDLINIYELVIFSILISILFPVACKLGKLWGYTGTKLKIVNFSRGWENQEIIYGIFQGLILDYIVLRNLYEYLV